MKKSLVILSVFAVGISYAQKSTEIPVFTTEKEKSEWIEKNPEKYNQPKDVKEMEFSSKAEKQAFHADPVREKVIVSDDSSGSKYDKMSTAKESKNAETIRAKERKEFTNQKN